MPDNEPSEPKTSLVARLRREYRTSILDESTVDANPVEQFRIWFAHALNAEELEPNAMALATADAMGQPSARIVLLKGFDEQGFVFFTNYHSRKGEEIAKNPRVALVFWWGSLERQVRLEGRVERITASESDDYFRHRPQMSRLSAWASEQSHPVRNREQLEQQLAAARQRFIGDDIPRPEGWGGFRVVPVMIEFWQGRVSRLHDRLVYRRNTEEQPWSMERLSP